MVIQNTELACGAFRQIASDYNESNSIAQCQLR